MEAELAKPEQANSASSMKKMLNLSGVKSSAKSQAATPSSESARTVDGNSAKNEARVINLSHIKMKQETNLIPSVEKEEESETEACALQGVSINDTSDCTRIRPNTAFLTRFVGSIERSNQRHGGAERGAGDGADPGSPEHTIEDFRAEGRKKMLQLADYYGFSVQIKVKTGEPVGFKRKIKTEDIKTRLGEAAPSGDRTATDQPLRPSSKKGQKLKKQKIESSAGDTVAASEIEYSAVVGPASNPPVSRSVVALTGPRGPGSSSAGESVPVDKASNNKPPKKTAGGRSTGTVNLFKNAMTGIKK